MQPSPEAALGKRPLRSYVDLPTNTGILAQLSASRNLGSFATASLPSAVLPVFLHEATHHWCFDSPLGFALAALYQRAAGHVASLASNNSGEEEDGFRDFRAGFEDLFRFETAFRFLQPLIEGLALFAEFNVVSEVREVMPVPFGLAAALFAGDRALTDEERWRRFGELLAKARDSGGVVERKYQVLLQGIRPSEDPYCAGYLAVRELWSQAASHRPELSDSGTFLTFLRNFVFGDLVLVKTLLDGDLEGPNREAPFAGEFANRLRHRLHSLFTAEPYARFDRYQLALEQSLLSQRDHEQPPPADVSLLDARESESGWNALRAWIADLENKGEAAAGGHWSSIRSVLNERYVQVLDVSHAFVRVSASGICSVWENESAPFPFATGMQCRSRELDGTQGIGYVALLVSLRDSLPFFGVVRGNQIAFDTLAGVQADDAARLRDVLARLSDKVAAAEATDLALTALFRRGAESRHAHTSNIEEGVQAIYLGLALPWLTSSARLTVSRTLGVSGLGLAALLPKGKRHLFKLLVAWSLGATPSESEWNALLSEAGEEETLEDVLTRLNQAAQSVWGREMIYLEEGQIRAIIF